MRLINVLFLLNHFNYYWLSLLLLLILSYSINLYDSEITDVYDQVYL